MPSYTYVCKACNKSFSVVLTLSEYDKARVACPSCKSKKVDQKPSAFFAVTAKKS